jgi:hypothetical protein
MLNNFLKVQVNHNINETNRLNKLSKRVNNYENKKKYLLKNYDNIQLQKKINDIERLNDFKNIDNILLVNSNNNMYKKTKLDFLENIKTNNEDIINIKNNVDIDIDEEKFEYEFLANIKRYGESNKINNSINQINIVYQYKYLNDEKVTGFGDFIRCCFYIIQFTEKYNIRVNFHINEHPIKNYLSYFENQLSVQSSISKKIPFLKINNYIYKNYNNIITYQYKDIDKIIINYINSLPIYDGNVYIYLINHPDESLIKNHHKEKLVEILKPNDYLNNKIMFSMDKLKLNKSKFKVIHIRYEDDDNCRNTNNRIIYILNIIKSIILKTDDDIFLLSNKNFIKNRLIQEIPRIKTIFNNITHTAYEDTNTDENLSNTLQDFYIMSNSNYIYSFSAYNHGSGFSKWCAVTYNIPYICFLLE